MNLFGGVVIIGLIVSGVGAVYSFVAVLGLLISELSHILLLMRTVAKRRTAG